MRVRGGVRSRNDLTIFFDLAKAEHYNRRKTAVEPETGLEVSMSAPSIDKPRRSTSSSRRKTVELIRDLQLMQSYTDNEEFDRSLRKLLQTVAHELRLRPFLEYTLRHGGSSQERRLWLGELADYLDQLPPIHDYLTRTPLWEGNWYGFYPVRECLYFVLGSSLGQDVLVRPEGDVEGIVYARTFNRLMPTRYRRLKELAKRLDPERFPLVNSSAIVQVAAISSMDLRTNQKRAYLHTKQGRESLVVSRSAIGTLRRLLGLD